MSKCIKLYFNSTIELLWLDISVFIVLASGYMDDVKQQDTKRFSLYSPPSLLEKLREKAVKNRRSLNSEMLFALEQYLSQQEQQAG